MEEKEKYLNEVKQNKAKRPIDGDSPSESPNYENEIADNKDENDKSSF